MKKSDWVGLATSLGVHALLVALFSLANLGASEPQMLGYIEVTMGDFRQGRPVQQAAEALPDDPVPETPQETEPTPEEPTSEPPTPEEPTAEEAPATPAPEQEVDLPDEPERAPDEVPEQEVEEETIAPDPAPESSEAAATGTPEGSTGAPEGDDGTGADEEKAAPFQIEGLDRTTVYSELPAFTEKVNVDIKMRITVDPRGRVVSVFPLLKGNPELEQAVRDALQEWRFNPLPAAAPQENQTGVVTFRFRLE